MSGDGDEGIGALALDSNGREKFASGRIAAGRINRRGPIAGRKIAARKTIAKTNRIGTLEPVENDRPQAISINNDQSTVIDRSPSIDARRSPGRRKSPNFNLSRGSKKGLRKNSRALRLSDANQGAIFGRSLLGSAPRVVSPQKAAPQFSNGRILKGRGP